MRRPFILLLSLLALSAALFLGCSSKAKKNLKEIRLSADDNGGFRPYFLQDFQLFSLEQELPKAPSKNTEIIKTKIDDLLKDLATCVNGVPCNQNCCPQGPCKLKDHVCPVGKYGFLYSLDHNVRLKGVSIFDSPNGRERPIPIARIKGTETGVTIKWEEAGLPQDESLRVTFTLSNDEQFSFDVNN